MSTEDDFTKGSSQYLYSRSITESEQEENSLVDICRTQVRIHTGMFPIRGGDGNYVFLTPILMK